MYKKMLLALMLGVSFSAHSINIGMVRTYLAMHDQNKQSYSCTEIITKLKELPDKSIIDVTGLAERHTMLLTPEAREKICKELMKKKTGEFKLKTAQLSMIPIPSLKPKVKKLLQGKADEYVFPKKDEGNEQEAA